MWLWRVIEPAAGWKLYAATHGSALIRLAFEAPGAEDLGASHPVLRETERQLRAWFAGERTEFDLPLDPRGTPFQRDVWRHLQRIPYGRTRSYAEVARSMGRPFAARAVGHASGRNPVAIVIPCHRVIGSDGSLTGFVAGLPRKRALLDLEARYSGSPQGELWNQEALPAQPVAAEPSCRALMAPSTNSMS